MEQKRTLWIIAAAGMFLLVVLGAAFIIWTPGQKNNTQNVAMTSQAPVQPNNSGWTMPPVYVDSNKSTQLPPPVNPYENQTVSTKDLTVISENTVVYDTNGNSTESTTIDLNALKNVTERTEVQPQNINITLNLPETKYEPAPVVAQVVTPVSVTTQTVEAPVSTSPVPPSKNDRGNRNVSAPAPKTNTTAKSTQVQAPSSVKKPEVKVAEKKVEQFWVQAAAFSSKKTAESACSVLDENKIPADIFTYKDAKGKLFYRVRVGPYTTKSEAEYWRARIVKINDFSKGESYITSN